MNEEIRFLLSKALCDKVYKPVIDDDVLHFQELLKKMSVTQYASEWFGKNSTAHEYRIHDEDMGTELKQAFGKHILEIMYQNSNLKIVGVYSFSQLERMVKE